MSLPRLSWTMVFLTVLWVGLWDDVSVANVITGVIVAVAVLVFARQPRLARRDRTAVRVQPLAALHFIGHVIVNLVHSNLVLAWEIITPGSRINTGIVAVPLRTESRISMLIVANVVTLTPGTLTVEAKGSPPVLYIHVLHLRDLDAVRRDLHRLEELSVRAFGTLAAREQLAEEVGG